MVRSMVEDGRVCMVGMVGMVITESGSVGIVSLLVRGWVLSLSQSDYEYSSRYSTTYYSTYTALRSTLHYSSNLPPPRFCILSSNSNFLVLQ